jgi:chromosome segregation ATPase
MIMALLEQEKIKLQAAVDAAAAQVSAQQQALSAAQASLSAAQAHVADAQSQVPPLQAAAAAADGRAADSDVRLAAHQADQPEPTIEVDGGKPRPNPAWRVWKRQLDQLIVQRNQARADATAAHVALSNGQGAVAQAQIEAQSAERQVGETTVALQAAQAALKAARQRMAALERWRTEIARDSLDRTALQQVAAELSARAIALQESLTLARFDHEDAQTNLALLLERQTRLTATLADVNSRLPGAQTEVQAAQAAADAASAELFDFLAAGQ